MDIETRWWKRITSSTGACRNDENQGSEKLHFRGSISDPRISKLLDWDETQNEEQETSDGIVKIRHSSLRLANLFPLSSYVWMDTNFSSSLLFLFFFFFFKEQLKSFSMQLSFRVVCPFGVVCKSGNERNVQLRFPFFFPSLSFLCWSWNCKGVSSSQMPTKVRMFACHWTFDRQKLDLPWTFRRSRGEGKAYNPMSKYRR